MNERITTAGVALKNGQVFVAHRVKGGSLSGKWEFPGGKQRWGESDEETLRREYAEEFSADIAVGDLLLTFDFTNNDTLYHLRAYRIEILASELKLSVHTEARWVGCDELNELEMGNSDDQIRSRVTSLLLNREL